MPFSESNIPKILYHGSSIDIKNGLKPHKQKTCTGLEEGEFIFAGASKLGAIAYSLKNEYCCSFASINTDDVSSMAMIIENKHGFLENYKGGKIYSFSSKNFKRVTRADGSPTYEYVSEKSIPLYKMESQKIPGINTVMKHGVQIFFITDKYTREDFSKRHKELIANKIGPVGRLAIMLEEGFLEHYNKEQGINYLDCETGKLVKYGEKQFKENMTDFVGGGGIGAGKSWQVKVQHERETFGAEHAARKATCPITHEEAYKKRNSSSIVLG